MSKCYWLVPISILILAATGCSKLGGGLRRDFDDGQVYSGGTSGGRWAERGLLDDEEENANQTADYNYARVGHSERNPASAAGDGTQGQDPQDGSQQSWNTASRQPSSYDTGDQQQFQPARKGKYKTGPRARRADFIDESTNEGSLWAPDGQTNYYFSKNKVRSVGDIVTVTLDDQMVKDISMEVKRTLTKQEALTELGVAQQKLIMKKRGGADDKSGTGVAAAGTGASRAPAAEKPAEKASSKDDEETPEPTMNDVDLASALEVKASDSIMAEIVERYPNGNYKIRGTKKVLYKNGSPRLLTMVAIAKGSDISEEDVVNSGKLYEYRLEAVR